MINTIITLIDGLFYNGSHQGSRSAQEAPELSPASRNVPQIFDSNQLTIEARMTSVKLIVPLHVRPAFFFSESNWLPHVARELGESCFSAMFMDSFFFFFSPTSYFFSLTL